MPHRLGIAYSLQNRKYLLQMLDRLFSNPGFMPHIHCYLGQPTLVWTMLVTDLLIGLAYVSISLTLWGLVRKVQIAFTMVVLCFGIFIAACGATHFMEIWTLWKPDYWMAAAVKLVTAIASVGTGAYLFRLRHGMVEVAEASKLAEQRRLDLEAFTKDLETRVAERTQDAENLSRELQTLFEVAPVGMVQVDPGTLRFVRVNPKFCDIVGYARDELLSKSVEEITAADDQATDRALFQDLLNGTRPELSYEKRYRHKNGHIVWGSVGVTLLRDSSGAPYRTVTIVQDITIRKKVEEALKASELRYRTLTETLPQLVWTCLPDGRCDYLSQQWINYTGVSLEIQLGFDWLDRVIHPDDRKRTLEHWIGAVEGRHPYDIEYRIRRHDGVYRWFKTRGTPIRDQEGKVSHWFGTCTDIEDQKKLEQALRESTTRFESIANNIPQLAWMTDRDGGIFWYNQNWYDYTGTTLEQMRGWGWKAVHHPDHVERVMAKWMQHLRSGEPWEDIFPLKSLTGDWRWFLSRARPTRDERGQVIHWLGTNTDITEQRKAREELVRTNIAKDEFLSICSHELRTPVTVMKLSNQTFLRTLKKDVPTTESLARAKKVAEQTDRQLDRLTSLIEAIMDFSGISTGKMRLRREHFDISELTAEVVERMRPQFEAAGSMIATRLAPKATGTWDRLRLNRVLTNLLSNALKYGSGRPVTVTVFQKETTTTLIVRDEGIGIAETDQTRIFQAYERAVPASNISGLGLGLFLSRQIIEAHGGSIKVESKLREGASFTVELPSAADS